MSHAVQQTFNSSEISVFIMMCIVLLLCEVDIDGTNNQY